MSDSSSKLIKYAICIGVIAMILFALIAKPKEVKDWIEFAGYSISIGTAFALLYEKVLWRVNPFEAMPRLKKKYEGILCYKYNGQDETKSIQINIKQTLLKVKVKTYTDMNSSTSVMGSIIKENEEYVLFYSYITNPDINVNRDNPMQIGTCRMELNKNNVRIKGHYWTNRMTGGDLTWFVGNGD